MHPRVHGRAPVRVRVQFRSASSLLVAYSLNLSRGGIFIETESPPEVGDALEIVLEAARTGPVAVRGRVTWRRATRGPDGPAGVGVEFDDLTDALGATIDQLVAEFTGVNVLLYCPDARERETLRRMLRSVVSAAEVVPADRPSLCQTLCDESVDLVVVEADDDLAGALAIAAVARGLPSPIPVVALCSDDAGAAGLRDAGVGELIGNPPTLADLSRAVVRALGRPTAVGPL